MTARAVKSRETSLTNDCFEFENGPWGVQNEALEVKNEALDLQNEALELQKAPPEPGGRFWLIFGRLLGGFWVPF